MNLGSFTTVSLIAFTFAGSSSTIDLGCPLSGPTITVSHPGIERTDTAILVNTCLITDHMQELILFYENVLQMPAEVSDSTYAAFHTGGMVLALFSAKAQEKYIPGSTRPAFNKSAILEFQVENVDQQYLRLQPIVKNWVKSPTTQPWGTRSIYFRDPEGNLVNFFQDLGKR